jgi:4,5-dihydroxyphthalate decarboxylase
VPKVPLTLGCIDYLDRTRPIFDGLVETPGIDLTAVPLRPPDLFGRLGEFDVHELSLAAHLALPFLGDDRFVGLPVFPYRSFLAGNVVVNSASGIERPADLAGKRVGTPGLHLAGTIWSRGFLSDEYKVRDSDVQWVTSLALFGPVSERLARSMLAPELAVEDVPTDRSLSDMLERGEIDAWVGPSLPACFERGSPAVRRLFPDYRAVEEDYARRSRIFPILHTLILRRELYERHRWIAGTLLQVFERARQLGSARLVNDGVYACALPWLRHDLETLPALFGGDWYRNGFRANREVLATAARYAAEQHLTPQPVDVSTAFAAETLG